MSRPAQWWRWLRARQRILWLEYSLLSLAVMAPLLLPGYILTLDMVFTPQLRWPSELSNTYLFEALLHLLNFVIPADIIQKAILLVILLLSGVGMHRLAVTLRFGVLDQYMQWGAYFAGVLYMINPFTYSRFMAGQYLVLLGYALMPFFVRALLRLVESPGWRRAALVAVWAAVIGAVSIHAIGMLVLVVAAVLVAAAWRYRLHLRRFAKVAGWVAAAAAVTVAVHSFWLVPTLIGATNISQATAQFEQQQPQAFTTTEGTLGSIGNVIRLQGFWQESRHLYTLPQEQLPAWGLVFVAIWIVVGVGVVITWRRQRFGAIAMGIVLSAAIVLAATPLLMWLGDIFPLLAGYREPHKFAGLVAMAYAFFGAVGSAWLLSKVAGRRALFNGAIVVLILLPLLSATTMLWGFNGQLSSRSYPSDWFAVNQQLNNNPAATKILFLPWHQYMSFDFTGRIIATPAAKFFDKPVVVSDDPEFKDAGPTIPNPQNRQIEQEVLQAGPHTRHLGERLRAMGISHVLLAKEGNYAHYSYLDAQNDLHLEATTNNLNLYRVLPKGGDNEEH